MLYIPAVMDGGQVGGCQGSDHRLLAYYWTQSPAPDDVMLMAVAALSSGKVARPA